ncbi:hypothetical protein K504DRAFT_457728 [Pleomassaria siparia CBS 279.74]|uniref:Uncharacterized protein n=1 Tax=Pleomassaria siparia CBS 279.74 TaxID=1314801 RepID=A0A6G1KRU4_9PLEO|nr:hypothetical protein K504DRAFT_457728 [Pleomassaria siparia CBS 279.74]
MRDISRITISAVDPSFRGNPALCPASIRGPITHRCQGFVGQFGYGGVQWGGMKVRRVGVREKATFLAQSLVR